MLSGLKDVDREILKHVDDKDLVRVCSTDRKTWNDVCDDNFLKRRLSKYPGIEKYKRENESWKQFFLRFIYYTSKMREDHQFEYTFGDFKKQFATLENHKGKPTDLLLNTARNGDLPLVSYSLEHGADIHIAGDYALRYAVESGNFDVMKYLIEHGGDINVSEALPLRFAVLKENLEMVKYLVERGADVQKAEYLSLRDAAANNDLQMIKYLVEHGADIHVADDLPLQIALERGYSDIVEYIENLI